MNNFVLVAAPQTNIFGSAASTSFGAQTTGFGQTGFAQPNQVGYFKNNISSV